MSRLVLDQVQSGSLTRQVAELLCVLAEQSPYRDFPDVLWSSAVDKDGQIVRRLEQARCEQLRAWANPHNIGVGHRERVPDVSFSFDSTPTPDTPKFAEATAKARDRGAQASEPWTPFERKTWEQLLHHHPDRLAVSVWLDTLTNGANLCFRGDREECISRPNYDISAKEAVELISNEIKADCKAGHTVGPFKHFPFPNARGSPVGSAAKRDNGRITGWRRIADLSAGGLDSINAQTDRIFQRVDSWDDIWHPSLATLAQNHDVYLCKDDVRQAFRCVPVRFAGPLAAMLPVARRVVL